MLGFLRKFVIWVGIICLYITAQSETTVVPLESTGDGPIYYLDHAEFQGIEGKTYVEFYLQVGYSALQFYKQEKKFEAGYTLDFVIEDNSGAVVEHSETSDSFQVATFGQTLSRRQARIQLLAFTLNPGKYVVRSVLQDRETRKSTSVVTTLNLRDFHSADLLISDIQLSQRIELVQEQQAYVKNQRYIEPNAVRVFSHGLADIYLYFEVYNLLAPTEQDSTYTAHLLIRKQDGEICSQLNLSHSKPGNTAAHSLKLPVSYFRAGQYTLTINVEDNATGHTSESSVCFTVVENPPLSVNDLQPNRQL